jgi:hypothetical protein
VQVHGCKVNVVFSNNNGIEVARGIIQVVEAGDALEGLVLTPSKEVILIIKVFVPSQEVYEILLWVV